MNPLMMSRHRLKMDILAQKGGKGTLLSSDEATNIRFQWRERSLILARQSVHLLHQQSKKQQLSRAEETHMECCMQQIVVHDWCASSNDSDSSIDSIGMLDLEVMVDQLYCNAHDSTNREQPFVPLTTERKYALFDECGLIPYDSKQMDYTREVLCIVEQAMSALNNGHIPSYRQVQHSHPPMKPGYFSLSLAYLNLVEQEELARQMHSVVAEP